MSTTIGCNHCIFEVTSKDIVEAIAMSDRHIASKHPETKRQAKGGEGQ